MSDELRSRLHQAVVAPTHPHPLLSALQFANQTNEIPPDDGVQGASLNVRTGQLLRAGETDRWMVGGHVDKDGNKVEPVHVAGRQISLPEAVHHVIKVSRRTAGQGPVAAGSWYDPSEGHIDLDASTPVPDRETATALMKQRNEKATFNLKTFEQVDNGNYREPKKK